MYITQKINCVFHEDTLENFSKYDFWATVKDHCHIAGSYPLWLTTDNLVGKDVDVSPNDIDLFCISKTSYNILYRYLKSIICIELHDSIFATSFKLPSYFLEIDKIQLIKYNPEFTSPNIEELLSKFDFTVSTIAFKNNDEEIPTHYICHRNFFEDLDHQALTLNNIHCPIGTLKRIMKYNKKGFKVPTKELVKLFVDWDSKSYSYRDNIVNFFLSNNSKGISAREIVNMLYID